MLLSYTRIQGIWTHRRCCVVFILPSVAGPYMDTHLNLLISLSQMFSLFFRSAILRFSCNFSWDFRKTCLRVPLVTEAYDQSTTWIDLGQTTYYPRNVSIGFGSLFQFFFLPSLVSDGHWPACYYLLIKLKSLKQHGRLPVERGARRKEKKLK